MNEDRLKVAHIDDDDDLRAIVRLALQSTAGCDVQSLGSGRAALELLPAFQPDVILVDMLMPGMDGVETVSALRELMDLSQVSVVFATGSDEDEWLRRVQGLGQVDIIRKPFDAYRLAERLHDIRLR